MKRGLSKKTPIIHQNTRVDIRIGLSSLPSVHRKIWDPKPVEARSVLPLPIHQLPPDRA